MQKQIKHIYIYITHEITEIRLISMWSSASQNDSPQLLS